MGVSLQFCDGSMTATLRRESDFVSAFVMRRNGVPAIVGCVFTGVYERFAEAFTSGSCRQYEGRLRIRPGAPCAAKFLLSPVCEPSSKPAVN